MNVDPSELLQPGEVFGPYEVVRLLGKGTFGAVYEVVSGRLRTRSALKVLHAMWSFEPQVVARFQREARAVAALCHHNVVAVYELDVIRGRHIIEMEFLTGRSLKSHLAEALRLPIEDALDLVLPVISALQAAHDQDIVHRDIKPENILLASEADGLVTPKVLDFGVARVIEDGVDLTSTGQQIGTPSYMSPEQVRADKDIDGRADQWAVGVLLYVMLAGARPFHAQNRFFTYELIMRAAPPPMRDHGVTIPAALEAVILRALEKDREARYPTMREFGAALARFARPEMRARYEALWGADLTDVTDPTTTRLPAGADATTRVASPSPAPRRTVQETKTLLAPPLPPVEVQHRSIPGAPYEELPHEGSQPRLLPDEPSSDAGIARKVTEDTTRGLTGRWKLATVLAAVTIATLSGLMWTSLSRKGVPPTASANASSPTPAPHPTRDPEQPANPRPAVEPPTPVMQQLVVAPTETPSPSTTAPPAPVGPAARSRPLPPRQVSGAGASSTGGETRRSESTSVAPVVRTPSLPSPGPPVVRSLSNGRFQLIPPTSPARPQR